MYIAYCYVLLYPIVKHILCLNFNVSMHSFLLISLFAKYFEGVWATKANVDPIGPWGLKGPPWKQMKENMYDSSSFVKIFIQRSNMKNRPKVNII